MMVTFVDEQVCYDFHGTVQYVTDRCYALQLCYTVMFCTSRLLLPQHLLHDTVHCGIMLHVYTHLQAVESTSLLSRKNLCVKL